MVGQNFAASPKLFDLQFENYRCWQIVRYRTVRNLKSGPCYLASVEDASDVPTASVARANNRALRSCLYHGSGTPIALQNPDRHAVPHGLSRATSFEKKCLMVGVEGMITEP